jgi:GT2 family glycosyltransferase
LSYAEQPRFSIVIATFSRPAELQIALQAMSRLDYPKSQFEVIVVDDGSPVPLDAVVIPFNAQIQVRLIRQQNAGCGSARNTGAGHARGRYLAFTDDDCHHAPDWLTRLEDYLEKYPDAMVGGLSVNALRSNPFSAASQLLMEYLLLSANPAPTSGRYLNNIAMPREEFVAMGGFDVTFSMSGEDRDLCDRWTKKGNRIVFAPDIIIGHAHQLNWRSYWKQHRVYGRGAFHLFRKGIAGSHPLVYYVRLLCFPFTRESWGSAIRSSFLIGTAQVATAVGLLQEWRKSRSALS